MSKHSRADSKEEAANSVFEDIFAINNSSSDGAAVHMPFLKWLKAEVLSKAAKEEDAIHMQAKEFTLSDAVDAFGLTYDTSMIGREKHKWKIQTLAGAEPIEPSNCFLSTLENYIDIYDRSSEAACRLGFDLLLCECIGSLRGKRRDGRSTPTLWDSIHVHCEVSFTHPIANADIPTTVAGRVDHGVGLIMKSRGKKPNRLFHSLLLCAEAKFESRVSDAIPQLVVYLASLRQSRIGKGRSNSSVYGLATDGLCYVFVTINEEGVILKSKQFDILEDLSTILGCLKYILERAISMSPNSTPEKGGTKTVDDSNEGADDLFVIKDTPCMRPNDEEEL